MGNLSTEQKIASAIDEISAEGSSRLPARTGIYGSNSVSQKDYIQLLLVQERRLENLQMENRKLASERDFLNEKYQAQLQINKASKLQSHANLAAGEEQAGELDELPMIDASEFQPVKEQPVLSQRQQLQLNVSEKLEPVTSAAKATSLWCGRKLFALLT